MGITIWELLIHEDIYICMGIIHGYIYIYIIIYTHQYSPVSNSPFLRGIGRGEDSRGHPLGRRRGGVPEVREAGEISKDIGTGDGMGYH